MITLFTGRIIQNFVNMFSIISYKFVNYFRDELNLKLVYIHAV
jgi:hypothetical protein